MNAPSVLRCVLFLVSLLCLSATSAGADRPRIAITGLAIESSTFSPARSDVAAFRPRRGRQVYAAYPFLAPGQPLRERAEYLPALTGRAIPGGAVTRAAYEELMGEIVERLRADMPYDGVFLDIHGAMSVVGLDDPEGDLIARVRAAF